jgi:hypothetical protein
LFRIHAPHRHSLHPSPFSACTRSLFRIHAPHRHSLHPSPFSECTHSLFRIHAPHRHLLHPSLSRTYPFLVPHSRATPPPIAPVPFPEPTLSSFRIHAPNRQSLHPSPFFRMYPFLVPHSCAHTATYSSRFGTLHGPGFAALISLPRPFKIQQWIKCVRVKCCFQPLTSFSDSQSGTASFDALFTSVIPHGSLAEFFSPLWIQRTGRKRKGPTNQACFVWSKYRYWELRCRKCCICTCCFPKLTRRLLSSLHLSYWFGRVINLDVLLLFSLTSSHLPLH